jgi:hypothetical protein
MQQHNEHILMKYAQTRQHEQDEIAAAWSRAQATGAALTLGAAVMVVAVVGVLLMVMWA